MGINTVTQNEPKLGALAILTESDLESSDHLGIVDANNLQVAQN